METLKKWAGWVGIQPVVVTTDHKSLEDWVHEKMDKPSGPARRRARWHEVLYKFDLSVQYVLGRDKVVADAMSRFAYPACKTFQDVSTHGSAEAREDVQKSSRKSLPKLAPWGYKCGVGKRAPTAGISCVYVVLWQGGESCHLSEFVL